MNGAMSFFAFVFIMCQIIAISIQGGGMAVTRLSADLSAVATTVNVTSTTGFLDASPAVPAQFLVVGDSKEVITYTSKTDTTFTVYDDPLTAGIIDGRGVPDSQTGEQYDAIAHDADSKVMTSNVGAIDSFVGYNIGSAQGVVGAVRVVLASGMAIFKNIPRMLVWDYPWFQGPAVILRFPLFALSAGFVWGMFIVFLQLAQGILRVL